MTTAGPVAVQLCLGAFENSAAISIGSSSIFDTKKPQFLQIVIYKSSE